MTMTMKILAVGILTLVVAAQMKAKDKVTAHFRPLYEKFGQDSATKVEVLSGPADVKMRNGGVSGKRWIAKCGEYRFKRNLPKCMPSAWARAPNTLPNSGNFRPRGSHSGRRS